MEEKYRIMSDLKSKECTAEKDVLHALENIGNEGEDLPELYDLVDKDGSKHKMDEMSKDSINLFAVSVNDNQLPKSERKLFTDIRVTESGELEFIEGNSDMREEIGDGIEISSEVNDWDNKEGFVDGKQNKSGNSVNPFSVPADDIEFKNETEKYTDKRVMECQLPELIVCFKDGAYQVVKDICIDDGLPSFEKISVENLEMQEKGLLSFLQSDFEVNDGLSQKLVETSEIVSYQTNPFVECDCKSDVGNECTSENFTGNGEEYFDEIRDMVSYQGNPFLQCDYKIDVGDKCSSETSTGNGDGDFEDTGDVITHEKAVPENLVLEKKFEESGSCPHPESFNFDDNEGQQLSDQDMSKVAVLAYSMTYTTEESKCDEAFEVPCDNKQAESGSITFDFSSSQPATSSGGKESPNNDEAKIDSRTASNRSVFIQHTGGESSFSAVDSLSGSIIAYSGQIPFSGSISLRSDSSTTSTRSFAFPVLHSEWNSSPVKMAKPDRRHYRKHRGWRHSLLCCRF